MTQHQEVSNAEVRDGLCAKFAIQNLDMNQVRLLRCDILLTSSPGVVASPGSPGRSSPPGFLFFFLCGVAPNLRILRFRN